MAKDWEEKSQGRFQMDSNRPAKRLRATASTACHPCRIAKKRCEGGAPCMSCTRRGLPCTRPIESNQPGLESEDGRTDGSTQKYIVDVHTTLYDATAELLDRYFQVVAPVWPLVHASDLSYRPFPSPLLVRSICLVSAISFPQMDAAVVRDLTESVYQCLAVDDLLTSPSLSTLQAFLLLLGCPSFTQRPIMIASVIRMASILGMNRPQPKRPIIYWTCVTWARWEAVKSKYKDSAVNHALHLPPPPCEPTNDSFFGRIYHLIAKSQDRDSSEDTHQKLYMQRVPEISLGPDGPEEDDTSAAAGPEKMIVDHLEQVLEVYLFGDSRKWTDAQGEITRYLQSPWYRFHPFCEISKQFGFAAK